MTGNFLAVWLNGETLVLDNSGAAFWPAQGALIFADLHLEKGSSYARGRQFLPPYDTDATLFRLAAAVRRFSPRLVVALGDSFHDREAAERLSPAARALLTSLGVQFVWIAGNHDPEPPGWLGGEVAGEWRASGLIFRHEPREDPEPGEIAGHLHPCARAAKWGRSIRRRCFAADHRRMVLPSFGAYTGGLDVAEEPIAKLFGARFHAYMLGSERVYAIPRFQAGRRKISDEIQPIISAITTAARP
jgi:DNA ligase-associated metallophosphoesterase